MRIMGEPGRGQGASFQAGPRTHLRMSSRPGAGVGEPGYATLQGRRRHFQAGQRAHLRIPGRPGRCGGTAAPRSSSRSAATVWRLAGSSRSLPVSPWAAPSARNTSSMTASTPSPCGPRRRRWGGVRWRLVSMCGRRGGGLERGWRGAHAGLDMGLDVGLDVGLEGRTGHQRRLYVGRTGHLARRVVGVRQLQRPVRRLVGVQKGEFLGQKGGLVCLDVSRHRGVDACTGGPKAHLEAAENADEEG